MELFSTRAYEDVWIEEVAEIAGVSRGLLYYYFPNKRDFYVAVSRAAAAEAANVSAPDVSLPPAERLRHGIDAFVRYAEEHSQGFLTAWRGSLAGDPEVRAIADESRERQAARILEAVAGGDHPPPLLRLAIYGWIALAQSVIAQWLEGHDATRADVSRLLSGSLEAVTSVARASADR